MLPARMTMFCIVGLRCSSEGPSLRRDPAKAVGRLPQLPPLRQLAPKAPGGAGSRVCAATRLGAAGVAGGSRTDLGDQSGGGMVLSKADRGRTAEPSSLLATATRQAPMRTETTGMALLQPSLPVTVVSAAGRPCHPRCDRTGYRVLRSGMAPPCFIGQRLGPSAS